MTTETNLMGSHNNLSDKAVKCGHDSHRQMTDHQDKMKHDQSDMTAYVIISTLGLCNDQVYTYDHRQ